MARKKIYVDGGSFDFPYYKFSGKGSKEVSRFKLTRGNKYSFSRLPGVTSHPFYITDSIAGGAPSKYLKKRLSGDGGVSDGVIGSEEFALKIGKKFKLDELYYFCTSHPDEMLHSFSIIDKKKKSKDHVDSDELVITNLQANRSYREVADADVGVVGDFDPCSNIV
tara:strand:- start:134 stop:631 length:498 start_codon:yes stop_codon:yes gene_type:complete